MTTYPLAHKGGAEALLAIIQADMIWRSLTKPQRELVLSSVAGYPVAAHARTITRLIQLDLVDAWLNPTEKAKQLVKWRTR